MAKLNKIMPPRNTKIRGQDHLLAYITPEEAALLKARGGSGKAGPMGIPQYGYGDDDGDGGYGDGDSDTGGMGSGDSDTGGGGGNNDNDDGGFAGDDTGQGSSSGSYGGGGGDNHDADLADTTGAQVGPSGGGMSQSQIDAAINDAMADLGPDVSEYGIATDNFGSNLFGGQSYPVGTEYGQPNYQAVTDVYNQIEQAKQYQQPIEATIMSLFNPFASLPKVQSLATQFMGPRFINALAVAGNTPIYSGGRLTGVKDKYGNVVEGRDPNADEGGSGRDGYSDSRPEKVPEDLLTGCPEGYVKDDQLGGFCRLDTRPSMGDQPSLPQVPFQPGGYARMGLLDEAPTNLPQFQQRYGAGFGSPSEFAAANTAFRQQSAYRPEYFKRPYPTDGYETLRS